MSYFSCFYTVYANLVFFSLLIRPPPTSTLFPYTTLFRSIEILSSLISVSGRELILGIDRDISERKQAEEALRESEEDRKSTRLNSSHRTISYAVFCLKKKTEINIY